MKKRLICILMVLLLFSVSCVGCAPDLPIESEGNASAADLTDGELIKERLDIPGSVQDKFISESGLSRVLVDADILVPKVSGIDIVEALPRIFSEDEIASFITRHEDEIGWYHVEDALPYAEEMPEVKHSTAGVDMYMLWLNNIPFATRYSANTDLLSEIRKELPEELAEDYTYTFFSVSYGLFEQTGKIAFIPTFSYIRTNESVVPTEVMPLTDGRAKDCTMSLEEAISVADEEVHALVPDYEVSAYGQLKLDELANPKQYYILRYTRHLNGVPLNDSYGAEAMDNEFGYTSGLGVISVVVSDSGVCSLEYYNPTDVGETVKENTELLPFDDIWDIFSKVSLLSIQNLEVYEEIYQNDLEVYEIRLGYMAVLQADDSYHYTPVWDFYARRYLKGSGSWAGSSDLPPIEGRSCLTINAIDGTIIDRSLGY